MATDGKPTKKAGKGRSRGKREEAGIKVIDKRAATKLAAQEAEAPAQASTDATEADAPAEIERLNAELAALEERHTSTLNRLTRAQADLSNFRRRAESEGRELAAYSNQAFAYELLRVLDAFERAFLSIPPELRELTWLDGIALISSQLRGVLDSQGVVLIECKPGDELDINIHQAVTLEEGVGPMVVVQELQRGYRMHERVLRPALVKAGPRSEAPAAEPAAPEIDAAAEATHTS